MPIAGSDSFLILKARSSFSMHASLKWGNKKDPKKQASIRWIKNRHVNSRLILKERQSMPSYKFRVFFPFFVRSD